MGKTRKPDSETSELVRAATQLIDALKGASPEAIAVARESYDAVLARYSAGTEAILALLPHRDTRPND